MNWEAIGAIGEIVGVAGVIVTLIYLAAQIRLNTAMVKGTAHQTQIDSTDAMAGLLAGQIAARRAWEEIKAAYDDDFQAHVAMTPESLDVAANAGSVVPGIKVSVT